MVRKEYTSHDLIKIPNKRIIFSILGFRYFFNSRFKTYKARGNFPMDNRNSAHKFTTGFYPWVESIFKLARINIFYPVNERYPKFYFLRFSGKTDSIYFFGIVSDIGSVEKTYLMKLHKRAVE